MQLEEDEGSLAKAIFGLLIAVPLILWNAWVASTIWLWFIVPYGVHPLTVANAAGMGLLISLLTRSNSLETEGSFGFLLVLAVLKPAMILFFAWIITFIL